MAARLDIGHGRTPQRRSERIEGTPCQGCCEVIPARGRHGEERYWCDMLHRRIDPFCVKYPKV